MARLFVFSVLAVAFSYMLAVIVDAVARILQTSPPNTIPTIKDVVGRVGITPWPLAAFWTVAGVVFGITALGVACIADLHGLRKFVTGVGGVVWIAAWVLGAGLGCAAIMMCLGLLLEIGSSHPSDPVPVPLLVTSAVTAGVSLVLALLLPRVRAASADAFTPSRI